MLTSDLRPLASGYYWLSLFLFALGLMSKPMLVTLPFLLLLLDFWPLGRLNFHPPSSILHFVSYLDDGIGVARHIPNDML